MRNVVLNSSLVFGVLLAWACGGGSDSGARNQANNGSGGSTAGTSAAGSTSGGMSAGGSTSGGTGGTASVSKCAAATVPVGDGTAFSIDDLEDGNLELPEGDGRSSKWFFQTDTSMGTSDPTPTALAPVDGGANGTSKALHVSGQDFTTWGVVLGVGLNDALGGLNCPYDASAYEGISFYAKGSGSIRFAVAQSAIYPTSLGGTCVSTTPADGDCFNAHGKIIELSSEWQKFEIAWSDLSQGQWGLLAEFDPKTIMLVEWAATNEQQPFDFWVDEVEFLAEAPGGGEGGAGGAPSGGGAGSSNEGGAGGDGG